MRFLRTRKAVLALTVFNPCGVLFIGNLFAQQPCPNTFRIEGTVNDPSGALVPGARITVVPLPTATSNDVGRYIVSCVPLSTRSLTVTAPGFEQKSVSFRNLSESTLHLDITLQVAVEQQTIQVEGNPGSVGRSLGTTELGTRQVQMMADDPDDFLRQLQGLSSNGGSSQSLNVMVDGFQNSSVIPPKNSIASLNLNPDDFLAEYDGPSWFQGRVEVRTKSGANSYHGDVFFTDSEGVFNATNPFSTTSTPATKHRYGFDLSGPLLSHKNDFSLSLEKRDIDEFNVVNAITIDPAGNQASDQQTISSPEHRWAGAARANAALSPNDQVTASFAALADNEQNQGVSGLTLPDAGYTRITSEYDLRLLEVHTISPVALNQARVGISWKDQEQDALSSTPSLQVSGAFTSGGSTAQNQNIHERDYEADDDVSIDLHKHSLKFGGQTLGVQIRDSSPTNFNGAFVFGGGSGPVLGSNNQPTGQTQYLSPLEQYRRAVLGLPGGTPTTYQVDLGSPQIALFQSRAALFAEDTIQVRPHLTVVPGIRYQFQSDPTSALNFSPRIGVAWSPDSKGSWVFHLHAGLFHGVIDADSLVAPALLLNGVRQQQLTVYSPSYQAPLQPTADSIEVSTRQELNPSLKQNSWYQVRAGFEHEMPHHWHTEASYYWGGDWGDIRMRNINAPEVASSIGTSPDPLVALGAPRPLGPDENILQFQNSGHLSGGITLLSINQASYKWFSLHANYINMNFRCVGCVGYESPQSSYSDQGESSRPDWLSRNKITFFGNLNFPYGLIASTVMDAETGHPFNITTGTDANGDGDFNDRPAYALANTPGAIATRWGLMTPDAVNGNVPRNIGTMPSTIHLDVDLTKSFALNHKNATHPLSLQLNARAANVINHTNVTAVGTVLSSSNFGIPIAAEPARRLELGTRFTF